MVESVSNSLVSIQYGLFKFYTQTKKIDLMHATRNVLLKKPKIYSQKKTVYLVFNLELFDTFIN